MDIHDLDERDDKGRFPHGISFAITSNVKNMAKKKTHVAWEQISAFLDAHRDHGIFHVLISLFMINIHVTFKKFSPFLFLFLLIFFLLF